MARRQQQQGAPSCAGHRLLPVPSPDTGSAELRLHHDGQEGRETEEQEEEETRQPDGDQQSEDEESGKRALPGVCPARRRLVVIDTAVILLLFFGSGVNCTVMGLTLVDLERQISSNTERMSALIVCRGVGILIGCLLAGPLSDRFNHALLIGLSTGVIGLGHLVLPTAVDIYAATAIYFTQAIGVGLMNAGSTFAMIKHWGKKAGPLLHSLLFTYDLAAFIAPLAQKLFINRIESASPIKLSMANHNSSLSTNLADMDIQKYHTNQTSWANEGEFHLMDDLKGCNRSLGLDTNCSASYLESVMTSQTDMLRFNLLIGGFIFCAAAIHVILAAFYKTFKNVWPKDQPENAKNSIDQYNSITTTNSDKGQSPLQILLIRYGCDVKNQVRVALFTALLTFVYSIEGIMVVLLVVFLVKGLHWDLQSATTVASIRGLICGCSRFLMICVSRVLSGRNQVFVNCSLCTVATTVMLMGVFWFPNHTWILILASSLALASLYGSVLTWASEQICMTGVVSAMLTTPFASGMVVGPTVASYLFERHGPHWFVYLMFLYTLVMDALVVVVVAFKNACPPELVKPTEEKALEMLPTGSTCTLNNVPVKG